MAPLPALELICLGTPTARVAGAEPAPDILWRHNLALLFYLALSPDRTRTREQLVGVLWPEKLPERSRHSLSEAIRRCRGSLGERRLLTEGDRVSLNGQGLSTDVQRLRDGGFQSPEDLIELLRGDFLEGFSLDDSQAFEDWATAERHRVRELAVNVCGATAERCLAQGDHQTARRVAQCALRIHPHSEEAAGAAMRASALGGDQAAALSLFHTFASRLEADLGERPSRVLHDLADRVRQNTWQRHSGRYRQLAPPLVGRSELHRRLFETVLSTPPRSPRCFAILGGPGSGKSRLLNECVERLALGGSSAFLVRLLETDHDAPWSTLRALMRAGLATTPGMAGVDPQALSALAAVVPELAERTQPVQQVDHMQVADALVAFLSAIAEEGAVALAIDEAQWADGATLDALRHVCRHGGDLSLTLGLTSGSGVHESANFAALLERVGREYQGITVTLEPFSVDEMEQLVLHMAPWCSDTDDRNRLARRVEVESAGNPLLAITLLSDLDKTAHLKQDLTAWPPQGTTFDAPLPFSIPSLVRVAIAARIARLDKRTEGVVRAASVTGVAIDLDLTAHLTSLARDAVEAALDELERHRLVVHTGSRYVFNGRLLPEAIRAECIGRGEQRRLRERAIEFLAGRDDIESRALRVDLLGALARHNAALDTVLGILESAVGAGAVRTATRALSAADRASARDPDVRAAVESYRQRLAG